MVKKVPLDINKFPQQEFSAKSGHSAFPSILKLDRNSQVQHRLDVPSGDHKVTLAESSKRSAPFSNIPPTPSKLDILCEAVKINEEKHVKKDEQSYNHKHCAVKVERHAKPEQDTVKLQSFEIKQSSSPLVISTVSPISTNSKDCYISPVNDVRELSPLQQWRGYTMCQSPNIQSLQSHCPSHPPHAPYNHHPCPHPHFPYTPPTLHPHSPFPPFTSPYYPENSFLNLPPPTPETFIKRPDLSNSKLYVFPHNRNCCLKNEKTEPPVIKKVSQPKKKLPRKAGQNKTPGSNVRMCQSPGCTKCAQGSTKFCIAHGGGRRCTVPGCLKGARDKRFCSAHGGGKRCSVPDCTKAAVGGSKLCTAHGGGRRCASEGCEKSAQSSTLYCVRHGGGRQCSVEGCTKVSRGKTMYCASHGGGKRCCWDGCNRSAIAKGTHCKRHSASVPIPC